ncbi:hypothetical protein IWQ61_005418 [Dispira simplex]|nr:hypothetical protein IWQ61_005418 [Dispira simplex]
MGHHTQNTFNLRVPKTNSVTIAELDGGLVTLSSSDDPNALKYVRAGGPIYPHLVVPSKLLVQTSDTHAVETKSIPHPQRPSTSPRDLLARLPRKQGKGWLEYASLQYEHWWQMKSLLLDSLEQCKSTYVTPYLSWLQPRRRNDRVENPVREPVTHLVWHPYKQIFALAHQEDTVFLYDMGREAWFANCLIHPFQKGITGLAWKPNAAGTLAVASRNGVCLWRITLNQPVNNGPTPQFDQRAGMGSIEPLRLDGSSGPHSSKGGIHTGHAWLDYLQFPGFCDVSCLAWDPTGHYLATGSSSQGTILIWDVATGTATALRRVPASTVNLSWSPDGMYFCSTHSNKQLRIWETSQWRSTAWSDFPNFVNNIAWAPDSRCVFFSLYHQDAVYHLVLHKPPPALEGQVTCLVKLSPQKLQSEAGTIFEVGGFISQLSLDPTGERLIVGFMPPDRATEFEYLQDNQLRQHPVVKASELLAVMAVKNRLVGWVGSAADPTLPCGFIRGPSKELVTPTSSTERCTGILRNPLATCFTFAQQFDRGALLTVAWQNGKVTFIPFLFATTNV